MSPTILTVLTPSGKGGIAVLALAGPKTEEVIEKFFRPLKKRKGSLRYGYFMWEAKEVDEVLVYHQPKHADYAEIHCHGGLAVVEEIIQCLSLPQVKGEIFLEHRCHQGEMDSISKDAWLALGHCQGKKALSMVLTQLGGALRTRIQEIVQLLNQKKQERAKQRTEDLLATWDYGKSLLEPPKILILGAPNVGKSSLLNRLLANQKALVTSVAGTTRDLISHTAILGDYPFDFCDSAGLRSTSDLVEKLGIEKAMKKVGEMDGLVMVFEASLPADKKTWKLFQSHREKSFLVVNKMDLGLHGHWKNLSEKIHPLSCLTGEGVPAFEKALIGHTFPQCYSSAVVFTKRQHQWLRQALSDLSKAEEILRQV